LAAAVGPALKPASAGDEVGCDWLLGYCTFLQKRHGSLDETAVIRQTSKRLDENSRFDYVNQRAAAVDGLRVGDAIDRLVPTLSGEQKGCTMDNLKHDYHQGYITLEFS
jgi:hypothetical protein